MSDDRTFLARAVELAWEGVERGAGGPFGCVVVRDGVIVGEGYNRVLERNDPTCHAEMEAIRNACARLGDHQLTGCTVYASSEPCPMCLGALYWARPDRVVFALTREDAREIGFDDAFIYEEQARPMGERTIPFECREREAAIPLFRSWMEKGDRRLY
jgi:guanine deaminase